MIITGVDGKDRNTHRGMDEDQPQQTYTVRWEIEIDADSPEEAAREARRTQQDQGSHAVVFDVTDENGVRTTVDLLDDVEGE